MLNSNNFRVLRRFEAIVSKDILLECFSGIFSNHENLADFLLTESKIKMQITAKVGNMSMNVFKNSSWF